MYILSKHPHFRSQIKFINQRSFRIIFNSYTFDYFETFKPAQFQFQKSHTVFMTVITKKHAEHLYFLSK